MGLRVFKSKKYVVDQSCFSEPGRCGNNIESSGLNDIGGLEVWCGHQGKILNMETIFI